MFGSSPARIAVYGVLGGLGGELAQGAPALCPQIFPNGVEQIIQAVNAGHEMGPVRPAAT